MFRIDMSGFKARGDIATLVGAPKGYQDSKDGGTLTTFMASHPVRSASTASFVGKDSQAVERGCAGMLSMAVVVSRSAFSLKGFSRRAFAVTARFES